MTPENQKIWNSPEFQEHVKRLSDFFDARQKNHEETIQLLEKQSLKEKNNEDL